MSEKLEDLLTEGSEVKDEQLTKIGEVVADLQNKEQLVKDAEAALKAAKEELRVISQETIPTMLDETGFSEIRLKTKQHVVVTDKIKAAIPKSNIEVVYQNMIKNQIEKEGSSEQLAKAMVDSLFKSQIVIDKPTPEVEDLLIGAGFVFDKAKSIHWKTLESYCVGLKERGIEIPEGINHYEYRETKIKK